MTKSLLLNDVSEEHCFNVKDGRILRNVEDLKNVLKDIEPKNFSKHVKGDKNEFAEWVQNSVKDEGLAKGLYRNGNDQIKALKVVENWLNYVVKNHKVKLSNRTVLVKQDLVQRSLYNRRLIASKERKVVKAESVKSILRLLKNG